MKQREEFICEGMDLKEGTYEGKPWKKYIVYGMVPEMCNIFGNPHASFDVPFNYADDILLHGEKPEEKKGRRFHVSYDKYRKPDYFFWDM